MVPQYHIELMLPNDNSLDQSRSVADILHLMTGALKSHLRKGFTILELLVTIGCMALLMALAIPSLRAARLSMARSSCLNKVGSLSRSVAMYCDQSRGYFPADFPDSSAFLSTDDRREQFRVQVYSQMTNGPLLRHGFLGADFASKRCPKNQIPLWPGVPPEWVDYTISVSAYLDARYLDPELGESEWANTLGAHIQRIDSALFPSAKAMVYERWVWHAWLAPLLRTDPLNGLQPSLSPGAISIAFVDGHAEQLRSAELIQGVSRVPIWGGDLLDLTSGGFRGRDK